MVVETERARHLHFGRQAAHYRQNHYHHDYVVHDFRELVVKTRTQIRGDARHERIRERAAERVEERVAEHLRHGGVFARRAHQNYAVFNHVGVIPHPFFRKSEDVEPIVALRLERGDKRPDERSDEQHDVDYEKREQYARHGSEANIEF